MYLKTKDLQRTSLEMELRETVDFKAVIRAIKKIDYHGYCTIESAPMVPDSDTAAKDGIEYLK